MRWFTSPALALALALSASADDPAASNPVDDFFKRWDANKDGIVSKDECESSRLFAKNDTDADGQITRAEVEAVWKSEEGSETLREPGNAGPDPSRGKVGKGQVGLPGVDPRNDRKMGGSSGMNDDMNKMRVRRIFNKFDKNGDDSLSMEEGGAYYFELLDIDRDGALMENELAANPRVGAEKARMAMQYYDKDSDGMISAAEWSMPEDGTFTKLDTNGDAKVSFEEALVGLRAPGAGGDTVAQPGAGQKRAPMDSAAFLKDNDSDGDGKVSSAEFKGPKGMFGKMDANADGFLDRTELDEATKKLAKLAGGGDGGGKGGGNMKEMVKRADKDGDGKVTREEWPGRPQMFDRMDKNGDGVLDDADFGEPTTGGTDAPGEKKPADDGSMKGQEEGSGK